MYHIAKLFTCQPTFRVLNTTPNAVRIHSPTDKTGEKVVWMQSDVRSKDLTTIDLGWIDTESLMKMRRAGLTHLKDIAAPTLVLTGCNKLISGIRGGEVTPETRQLYGRGMYGLPGGRVRWQSSSDVDVVTDTVYRELEEELGVTTSDIKSCNHIALLEITETILSGIKVVSVVETDLDFGKIEQRHRLAMDGWELNPLVAIENSPVTITHFLSVHEPDCIHSLLGALEAYQKWRWS